MNRRPLSLRQHTRPKVCDIAEDLLLTGELPVAPITRKPDSLLAAHPSGIGSTGAGSRPQQVRAGV
jgi:hypothetical protein